MRLKPFRAIFTGAAASVLAMAVGVSSLQAASMPEPQQEPGPPPQGQSQPDRVQQDQVQQDQAQQEQPQQDQDSYDQPQDQAAPDQGPPRAHSATLSPEQLQQLVAPIALYPDALLAQILAASAYPTQIVEAERFLQQNPGLKGKELGDAVDKQEWDPSVKALTQFPSVLANLDKDLSWTFRTGRRQLQPAGRLDAGRSGHAQKSGGSRTSEIDAAADCDQPGSAGRDSAGQSRGGVCSRIRSHFDLRLSGWSLARLLSVVGCRRPVSFLRRRLRSWSVFRIWLGLAWMGI